MDASHESLVPQREPGPSRRVRIAGLVALVALIAASGVACWYWIDTGESWVPFIVRDLLRWDLGEVKAAAKPTVEALDAYKQQHGRYPETLAEAGLTAPVTRRWGEYTYYPTENLQQYKLWVGYCEGGILVLYWDSAENCWVEEH